MSESYPVSERTRLRRRPQRGTYDRAAVHAILDEGFVCHLGFVDEGHVYVVPTGYVRVDDHVYVHAAGAGRIARSLSGGLDVCFTVTLIDGLVLARSAFHHSMNYRSLGGGRPPQPDSGRGDRRRAWGAAADLTPSAA